MPKCTQGLRVEFGFELGKQVPQDCPIVFQVPFRFGRFLRGGDLLNLLQELRSADCHAAAKPRPPVVEESMQANGPQPRPERADTPIVFEPRHFLDQRRHDFLREIVGIVGDALAAKPAVDEGPVQMVQFGPRILTAAGRALQQCHPRRIHNSSRSFGLIAGAYSTRAKAIIPRLKGDVNPPAGVRLTPEHGAIRILVAALIAGDCATLPMFASNARGHPCFVKRVTQYLEETTNGVGSRQRIENVHILD